MVENLSGLDHMTGRCRGRHSTKMRTSTRIHSISLDGKSNTRVDLFRRDNESGSGHSLAVVVDGKRGVVGDRAEQTSLAMILVWGTMAGVALPSTRSLMPDLQVSALGTFAMTVWILAPRDLRWMCLGGLALGLAAWTKYPALLLLIVPLMHPRDRSATSTFVGTALGLVFIGECWLAWSYERFHLVEVLCVLPRSPEEMSTLD